MKKILVLLIFLLLQNIVIPQELVRPIIVSPLIGDKLDRTENEYFYKIFPGINDFIEAEFFLNPDSSLNAKVNYEQDNMFKDTIIYNFNSLNQIQKYLINKVISDIKSSNTKVEEVKITYADNGEETTSIYSIDEKQVNTISIPKLEAKTFTNNQIDKIVLQKKVSLFPYCFYGSVLGGITGFIIGKSMEINSENNSLNEGMKTIFERTFAPFWGGLIGAGTGLLLGFIIGNLITADEIYIANDNGCFCNLDEYTILSLRLKLK